MVNHKKYPKRVNVHVTAEMLRKLEQVRDQRGAQATVPDVIRDAIRLYIDDQEQVIGSRRHFQKTLREEITVLGESLKQEMSNYHLEVLWGHVFTLVAVVTSSAPMLTRISGQQITPDQLLTNASNNAERSWERVLDMLLSSMHASGALQPVEK